MRFKLKLLLKFGLVITAALLIAQPVSASADTHTLIILPSCDRGAASQGNTIPPIPPILILEGTVFVGDDIAADGIDLTAQVGGSCTGDRVEVGLLYDEIVGNGRYELSIQAVGSGGRTITFHLNDGRVAEETELFADYNALGDVVPEWRGPIARSIDLHFAPDPVVEPPPPMMQIFRGSVLSQNFPDGLPDGVEIYAQIGEYRSDFALVENGRYAIQVQPPSDNDATEIQFFVRGHVQPATTAAFFSGDGMVTTFNIFFASLDLAVPPPPEPPVVEPMPPEPSGGGCRRTAGAISSAEGIANAALFIAPGLVLTAAYTVFRLRRSVKKNRGKSDNDRRV